MTDNVPGRRYQGRVSGFRPRVQQNVFNSACVLMIFIALANFSLYHNLPVVGPAVTNCLGSLQLPCSGGKCSATLCQIFVYKSLFMKTWCWSVVLRNQRLALFTSLRTVILLNTAVLNNDCLR